MKKTPVKFQKDRHKTVGGVAHTRYPLSIYFEPENWLSSKCWKGDKNQSEDYIQTTCLSLDHDKNTCKVSKFQKDRHKAVGGVAHTRYLLLIVFEPKKWLSSKCKKVTKINLRIISKPHAHLQTMTKTPVKFQKDWLRTVGVDAYTMYLLLEGGTEPRNYGKPNVPSLFFEKVGDKKYTVWVLFYENTVKGVIV